MNVEIGKFILRDKSGWPVESIREHYFTNLIRAVLITDLVQTFKYCKKDYYTTGKQQCKKQKEDGIHSGAYTCGEFEWRGKEAGKELPQMSELKPCEAIEILESIYPSKKQIVTGEYPEVAEALDKAIAALRRAQPANEPLTIEQLKQMDGEPVWCADGEGHSCYCLVNAESEDCFDSECGAWRFEFYGMTGDGENGLHNMGWLAYDHKPGGEQE